MTAVDFQKKIRSDFNTPCVIIAGARAIYHGPSLRLSPHRNAVATIAVGLERPFAITLPPQRRREVVRVAYVPPGVLHHVEAEGAMAFLYLDALSDDRALLELECARDERQAAQLARALSAVLAHAPATLFERALLDWSVFRDCPPGAPPPGG